MRTLILAGLAFLLLPVGGCTGSSARAAAEARQAIDQAQEQARQVARDDIAAGGLRLVIAGLGSEPKYDWLLSKRLGVRLQSIAACPVPAQQLAYAMAYNEEMTAEIERRFGRGILRDLQQEARVLARSEQGAQQQNSAKFIDAH